MVPRSQPSWLLCAGPYHQSDICDCCYVQVPVTKGGDSQRALKTLTSGLVVRESSIPNAGQGVFATKSFPARSRFGPYQGKMLTDPELAQASGYSWQVRKQYILPQNFVIIALSDSMPYQKKIFPNLIVAQKTNI